MILSLEKLAADPEVQRALAAIPRTSRAQEKIVGSERAYVRERLRRLQESARLLHQRADRIEAEIAQLEKRLS